MKASILRRAAFFMVRLSHPYMTTGKTIALTIQTFVGKVLSLLFTGVDSHFLLHPWKKSYHKLSVLKSRDMSLPTKVCIVKATVFPAVTYGCESWLIKEAES